MDTLSNFVEFVTQTCFLFFHAFRSRGSAFILMVPYCDAQDGPVNEKQVFQCIRISSWCNPAHGIQFHRAPVRGVILCYNFAMRCFPPSSEKVTAFSKYEVDNSIRGSISNIAVVVFCVTLPLTYDVYQCLAGDLLPVSLPLISRSSVRS